MAERMDGRAYGWQSVWMAERIDGRAQGWQRGRRAELRAVNASNGRVPLVPLMKAV